MHRDDDDGFSESRAQIDSPRNEKYFKRNMHV